MKAIVIAGTFFLTLSGCASESQQTAPVQAGQGGHQHGHAGMHMGDQMTSMCPMQVEGTAMSMSNTDNGLKMSFTTSPGNVDALRERVKQMAAMHSERHAKGMMGGKGHGQGMMVASTATAVDTENGADLLLVPKDATDLKKLRTHGRMMADKMQSGSCPTMHKQAAAETAPDSSDAVDHESHH